MWCLIDEIVCIPLCGNRDQARVGHSIEELVVRRVFGITLGYENLDYHNRQRLDPMLAIAVGKIDPTGSDSVLERDRCFALGGKSTLNRTELGSEKKNRYR